VWFFSSVTTAERASAGVPARYMIAPFILFVMMLSYLIIKFLKIDNKKISFPRLLKSGKVFLILGLLTFFPVAFYNANPIQAALDNKEFFSELKIKPFKEFKNQNEKEGLIAGTIMSIQEKKSLKGKPFAIVKFSDNTSEYELFLFSELLINNREKLKESNSFILTVSKDNVINNNAQPRVNVRKILDLSEMVNTSYKNVSIELEDNYNLSELENSLRERGKTQISIIIPNKDKRYEFKLENNRKFDLSIFKAIKNKEYVKKISF